MTGGSGLALNFAAACAHHFEPQRTRWGLGLLTYSVFLTGIAMSASSGRPMPPGDVLAHVVATTGRLSFPCVITGEKFDGSLSCTAMQHRLR